MVVALVQSATTSSRLVRATNPGKGAIVVGGMVASGQRTSAVPYREASCIWVRWWRALPDMWVRGLGASAVRGIWASRTELVGVPIRSFLIEDSRTPMLLDRLRDGLVALRTHGPLYWRWLARHVDHLLVQNHPGVHGAFHAEGPYVLISAEFLGRDTTTPLDVAVLIVHEVTHARIDAAGAEYVPNVAIRVERVCIRHEIAFARSLPDELGAKLLPRIEYRYANADTLWSPTEARRRTEEALAALGSPVWVRRVMRWLSR
ncbi:MAG: hypothetical protein R2909_21660 [Gemmatimonadales bacterium]